MYGEAVAAQVDLDRSVLVGPVHAGTARPDAIEGRLRRVAVRVPGTGRRNRHPRPDGIDERLGRRGLAPVVGDLEHVDPGQAAGKQGRIDALLDVAHEQESTAVGLAQEHDRDVVDPRPCVRRLERHLPWIGPQDGELHLAQSQVGARGEDPVRRTVVELGVPRGPAGARSAHARLVDASDLVALEDPGESGNVVLVRVGEHEDVEPPVPRRDARVEREQDAIRVRPTVDQHPRAGPGLEQDGIALPDVEDRQACLAMHRVAEGGAGDRDDDGDADQPEALGAPDGARRPRP